MTTAIVNRPLRVSLVVIVLVLVCLPPSVWADAIVLRNRSGAGGAISIHEAAQAITKAEFRSPPAPVLGDFTFGDSATASARGASGTVTANIATSVAPTRILARGNLLTLASQGNLAAAGVFGSTAAQIDLVLSEPHAFTYFGQFLLEPDGEDPLMTPILSTSLDLVLDPRGSTRIFGNNLANFSGLLVPPGTHVIEHSGVIGPGTYVFSAGIGSIFASSSQALPSRQGRIAFDVAFNLVPTAAPVPEPSTLALFGTAVVGMMGRAWRRRKHQT